MLFLIPARAGSKRLPGKNKRLFCGLPLWMWSFATAMRVKSERDEVVVSSDDPEILDAAYALGQYGQKRPSELCQDDSTTQSLIDWTFEQNPTQDSICLLQPTSPTRSGLTVSVMTSDAYSEPLRSVTNGVPNGQCWVYRRGVDGWIDIETKAGHDIDVEADFNAAEQDMMRRFA